MRIFNPTEDPRTKQRSERCSVVNLIKKGRKTTSGGKRSKKKRPYSKKVDTFESIK